MAIRNWIIKVDDQQHNIRLAHSFFTGKREIYLDGQQIIEGRNLCEQGSQYLFTVDNKPCEAGITTNGITCDYYLLIDGEPVEAIGYKTNPRNRFTRTTLLEEMAYWEKLTILLSLKMVPVPNEPAFERFRLFGYIRNYPVMIRRVFVPEAGAGFHVLFRIAQYEYTETILSMIKDEIVGKKIIPQNNNIIRYLELKPDSFSLLVPSHPKQEAPEMVAEKITTLVDVLSHFMQPLPQDTCEGSSCVAPAEQDLSLVFINGFPQLLCGLCINNITSLAKEDQAAYQKAPSGFGKSALAGVTISILVGILWAFAVSILENYKLDSLFAIMITYFNFHIIHTYMNESGMKPTLRNELSTGLIAIVGMVLGEYFSFLLKSINKYTSFVQGDIFVTAWKALQHDPERVIWIIFFGGFLVLPYILFTWTTQRGYLNQAFKPEVEVVEASIFPKQ